jgi:lipopolysaccharide export LptBFGC system permease protein LptF
MFTTKLNVLAPFALAALGVVIVAIEPAFAGTPVPTPIIGAGLPAIAVLAGGYWLIRKFRGSR